MATYDEAIEDELSTDGALSGVRQTTGLLASTAGLEEFLVPARGLSAPITDGVEIGEALVPVYGAVILEKIGILSQLQLTQYLNVYAADAVGLADRIRRGDIAAVADELGIAQTEAVQRGVVLLEQLGISSLLRANGIYNLSITQSIRVLDSLGRFFGGDIEEGIALAMDVATSRLALSHAADEIGVAGAVTPSLLISAVLAEGIDINPDLALRMIFQPTIVEGVELTAAYVAPDGSFTTWAMNTRTGAVTEYRDFVFNSFARLGNKYVGASDTGLYELIGDTDAGEDIIARIRSGFMQFGGTNLSRLKAAYIAVRGEGDFVLKIETADGDTYNYAVTTQSMRTAKVHMGKGQRSRYFAFELTSTGQDFDLDTLEFVPIVVQRRV